MVTVFSGVLGSNGNRTLYARCALRNFVHLPIRRTLPPYIHQIMPEVEENIKESLGIDYRRSGTYMDILSDPANGFESTDIQNSEKLRALAYIVCLGEYYKEDIKYSGGNPIEDRRNSTEYEKLVRPFALLSIDRYVEMLKESPGWDDSWYDTWIQEIASLMYSEYGVSNLGVLMSICLEYMDMAPDKEHILHIYTDEELMENNIMQEDYTDACNARVAATVIWLLLVKGPKLIFG